MVNITYIIVESSFGKELKIGSWFIQIVIGLSILPIILLVQMRKLNKDK